MKSIEVKIEHGVKLPPKRGMFGIYRETFGKMKVGDSFFIPDQKTTQLARISFSHLKRRNKKFKSWAITSRKLDKGYRFWRIQ